MGWISEVPSDSYDYFLRDGSGFEEAFPRFLIREAIGMASGTLNFSVFEARKSETINTLTAACTTAATATPTLARIGVWEWDDSLDQGTLIASTPNDTTFFSVANAVDSINLSAPWGKIGGRRYAIGVLIVSAAAMPTVVGYGRPFSSGLGVLLNEIKRTCGVKAGLADLPATLTSDGGSGPVSSPYWKMT